MFNWAGNFFRDFFGTKVFISYANDPDPTTASNHPAGGLAGGVATDTAAALAPAAEAGTGPAARPASAMDKLAERVAYAVIGRGLEVFFDKHNLPPGVEFDARIQRELASSSLLVFLITEKAVTPLNYTLTELKFATSKWRNPSGRVLPVMVRETNINSVPQYLRTVQILKPVGDIAAEVADDVAKLIRRIRVRKLAGLAGVVGVLALSAAAGAAYVGMLGGTFRIYDGYVLNDAGEVKAREEVGGFENCLSFCQRDQECNAFSYFPNGSCTLTRSYEQIVPRAGGRFGVRATLAQPQVSRPR